jgi:hypothetical protein
MIKVGMKIFDFEPQISSRADEPNISFWNKNIQELGQSF